MLLLWVRLPDKDMVVDFVVDDDEDRPFESMRVEVGAGKLAYRPNRLAFDADSTAAIAFTSGSTGTPVPNRKTWGALALGGVSEASRLGLCDRPTTVIIGTVPPQHMYGLESTVIMALRGGLIMHNQRPFFPADIEQALRGIDGDRVLVSCTLGCGRCHGGARYFFQRGTRFSMKALTPSFASSPSMFSVIAVLAMR